MTESEAIKVIKNNRPTSGYTILNEALGTAINVLEKADNGGIKEMAELPDKECDVEMEFEVVFR